MSSNPLSIFPLQHSKQLIPTQFTSFPFSVINLKISFPNLPLFVSKSILFFFFFLKNFAEGLE